jgi:hypothetical protein
MNDITAGSGALGNRPSMETRSRTAIPLVGPLYGAGYHAGRLNPGL